MTLRLLIPAVLGVALLLPIGTARAAAAWYAIDPVHTRVVFAVRHAGFSDALGAVSGSTGMIRFDPDDWSSARVDVEVPLSRVDLGDPAWNAATLADRLLASGRHPVARFVSTRVEPVSADRARVHGTLSLRGVSRPLVLEVVLNGQGRHPLPPFRRTVGFSATATLSRADYGITAWKSVIGDAVSLRIEAEATRTRDADAADGDGDGDEALAPADPPRDRSAGDGPPTGAGRPADAGTDPAPEAAETP